MPSRLQLFFFLTWLCASWSAGTPRLRHIDRSTCLVEPYTLSLSCFKHSWHRFIGCRSRLFLVNLGFWTWRLTCLWADVRIFLHLCIFGTCRWDSFKDLGNWVALPLQHDWNVHNYVWELPRVSVPSGSLALVFALHDLRDFSHLVDELNLQDFNRLLPFLILGNLCCVTTDISRILPLCGACATLTSACSWKCCQLCRKTASDASPLFSVNGFGCWNSPW